ncbi:MAG: amidohydrolase [Bacteroidota bacterium]
MVVILLPLILMTSFQTSSSSPDTADLVFINGKIWTVDSTRPLAEAVAIAGERIVEAGSSEFIKGFIGPKTKVIDLKGRLMLPGFIDNHTHFVNGGFQLNSIDLRLARDEKEFSKLITAWAKQHPDRWITGGDWDHERWPGGNLPTKELIDQFTPETPVFVNRLDGHMALANSCALKLAGVTKNTTDPPGGTIVRDRVTGEPTGILKDNAMSLVYRIVPEPTEEDRLSAARRALEEARRYGLTSIQDISSWEDVRVYQKLEKEGQLTTRVYCRVPISTWERLAKDGVKAPSGTEMLKLGSLKGFADGSLGSSTALFFDPYVQDPTTRGLATDIVLDGSLERWALSADRARLQLSIHAIGDSANSWVLDLFDRILTKNPSWDRRFRIEHAQHIHPKDFERFARLGVIASAQPYHTIDDGRWAEKRIGYGRCKTTYPFRTFLDRGVKLCFGSDWTVAPLSPLLGIHAAVTRQTIDGKSPGGWIPEQKVSVKEAITCYTLNNAYAAYEESLKGSITSGKLADLVVLSDDILSIDPVKIQNTEVSFTVQGGKIVYQKLP